MRRSVAPMAIIFLFYSLHTPLLDMTLVKKKNYSKIVLSVMFFFVVGFCASNKN